VVDYLNNIHAHLKVDKFKEIRANQEELVLQGPEGPHDVRIIQSYPSKVTHPYNPLISVGRNLLQRGFETAHRIRSLTARTI